MSLQITTEYLGTKKLFGGMKYEIDGQIHDALTESADWNSKYWDLEIDQLTSIKEKIRKEYLNSENGIAITVHWAGDEPNRDIEESLERLFERFEQGKIGTRDRYILNRMENKAG
jgi:hypothetical protein